MSLYYLSRRSASSSWYVAFRDAKTGQVGTKRSTKTSDKRKAESIAQTWLRDGVPGLNQKSNISFVDYLDAFWDYDESLYIMESLAAGHHIHRRHASDMRNLVRRYYRPYFGGRLLRTIDESELRSFILFLKTEKKLASATVNQTRNVAFVAIRYAKRDKLIESFDFDQVLRCGGSSLPRGILEPEEVKKLFEVQWRDPRSRLVNLISAGTGMRMGEIRALQVKDIGLDRIFVRHAWSLEDGGLKDPKNHEAREIPLLASLRQNILIYLDKSLVVFNPDSLLFPGNREGRPFDERQIVKDFYRSLDLIGINHIARKERNLVFHSWRHYTAKNLSMIAPKSIGMKILGHKTSTIFDHYANHMSKEDIATMRDAMAKLEAMGELKEAKNIEFLSNAIA